MCKRGKLSWHTFSRMSVQCILFLSFLMFFARPSYSQCITSGPDPTGCWVINGKVTACVTGFGCATALLEDCFTVLEDGTIDWPQEAGCTVGGTWVKTGPLTVRINLNWSEMKKCFFETGVCEEGLGVSCNANVITAFFLVTFNSDGSRIQKGIGRIAAKTCINGRLVNITLPGTFTGERTSDCSTLLRNTSNSTLINIAQQLFSLTK